MRRLDAGVVVLALLVCCALVAKAVASELFKSEAGEIGDMDKVTSLRLSSNAKHDAL